MYLHNKIKQFIMYPDNCKMFLLLSIWFIFLYFTNIPQGGKYNLKREILYQIWGVAEKITNRKIHGFLLKLKLFIWYFGLKNKMWQHFVLFNSLKSTFVWHWLFPHTFTFVLINLSFSCTTCVGHSIKYERT